MNAEYDHFAATVGSPAKSRRRSTRVRDFEPGDNQESSSPRLTLVSERGYSRAMFNLMALILVFLVGRLLFLQYFQGPTYRVVADQNRIRTVSVPAPRGSIIDRFGTPIVMNVPNFILTITPADIPSDAVERQQLINNLSHLIGLDPIAITAALNDRKHRRTDPTALVEHIPYDQALQWMVSGTDLPGVTVKALPTRKYVAGPAATHLIGYVGKISEQELAASPQATLLDVTGKTGLEKVYNRELTGRDGKQYVERDVLNRQQQVLVGQNPEPGQTLRLSIDLELQQQLYQRLADAVKGAHSPGGAAIALDPQTGQVLAMTSVPSYDDNWFVTAGHSAEITQTLTGKNKPLLNRAVAGQYPSGSIIKPIIAVGALAEKIVTPLTTVLSVGGFKVGHDTFPDWKAGGHGLTNLAKALAESVNTYFYAVGGGYQQQRGLGVDRIVKYLLLFGWGRRSGIDLPNEASGFLPTKDWRDHQRPSPWKLGDTYHLSIGQGDVEVTPLQIADGVAAIANNGTLYQPYVVTDVYDASGQHLRTVQPHAITTNLASRSVLAAVQNGMRQGVLNGSSRALQSLPVTAAGKTGTAQFGADGKTHAWFAAYAPYDHPSIVIVVLVEAGGEGNVSALPVAKDILQWYFTRQPPMAVAVDKLLTGQ